MLILISTIIFDNDEADMRSDNISLYDSLGGIESITMIADEFLCAMEHEPILSHFFKPLSTDRVLQIGQRVAVYLVDMCDGPAEYRGPSIVDKLVELNLSDQEWNAAMGCLIKVLEQYQINSQEIEELMAILFALQEKVNSSISASIGFASKEAV